MAEYEESVFRKNLDNLFHKIVADVRISDESSLEDDIDILAEEVIEHFEESFDEFSLSLLDSIRQGFTSLSVKMRCSGNYPRLKNKPRKIECTTYYISRN